MYFQLERGEKITNPTSIDIFPGEGNGNPLQDSCLENPMDRAVWQAIVHGVTKSRTRLSDFTSQTSFMCNMSLLKKQAKTIFCNEDKIIFAINPGQVLQNLRQYAVFLRNQKQVSGSTKFFWLLQIYYSKPIASQLIGI